VHKNIEVIKRLSQFFKLPFPFLDDDKLWITSELIFGETGCLCLQSKAVNCKKMGCHHLPSIPLIFSKCGEYSNCHFAQQLG
jgi:hypothetical protein